MIKSEKGSSVLIIVPVVLTLVGIVVASADLTRYLVAQNAIEQAAVKASRCIAPSDGECVTASVSGPGGVNWNIVIPGDIIVNENDPAYNVVEGDVRYTTYNVNEGIPNYNVLTTGVPLRRFSADGAYERYTVSSSIEYTINRAFPANGFPTFIGSDEITLNNRPTSAYYAHLAAFPNLVGFSTFTPGVTNTSNPGFGNVTVASNETGTGNIPRGTFRTYTGRIPAPPVLSSPLTCGSSCGVSGSSATWETHASLALKVLGSFGVAGTTDVRYDNLAGVGLSITVRDAALNVVPAATLPQPSNPMTLGGSAASEISPALADPVTGLNYWHLYLRGPENAHGGDPAVPYHNIAVPRGGYVDVQVFVSNEGTSDAAGWIDLAYVFDHYITNAETVITECGSRNLLSAMDSPGDYPEGENTYAVGRCSASCQTAASIPGGATANCIENVTRTDVCTTFPVQPDMFLKTSPSNLREVYSCQPSFSAPLPENNSCSSWIELPVAEPEVITVTRGSAIDLDCNWIYSTETVRSCGEEAYQVGDFGSVVTSAFGPAPVVACDDSLQSLASELSSNAQRINDLNAAAGVAEEVLLERSPEGIPGNELSDMVVRWAPSPVTTTTHYWKANPSHPQIPAAAFQAVEQSFLGTRFVEPANCIAFDDGRSYEDGPLDICPDNFRMENVRDVDIVVAEDLPGMKFDYEPAIHRGCFPEEFYPSECGFDSLSSLLMDMNPEAFEAINANFIPQFADNQPSPDSAPEVFGEEGNDWLRYRAYRDSKDQRVRACMYPSGSCGIEVPIGFGTLTEPPSECANQICVAQPIGGYAAEPDTLEIDLVRAEEVLRDELAVLLPWASACSSDETKLGCYEASVSAASADGDFRVNITYYAPLSGLMAEISGEDYWLVQYNQEEQSELSTLR